MFVGLFNRKRVSVIVFEFVWERERECEYKWANERRKVTDVIFNFVWKWKCLGYSISYKTHGNDKKKCLFANVPYTFMTFDGKTKIIRFLMIEFKKQRHNKFNEYNFHLFFSSLIIPLFLICSRLLIDSIYYTN